MKKSFEFTTNNFLRLLHTASKIFQKLNWTILTFLFIIHKVVFNCRLTKLERLLKAGVSANAGDGTQANNRALHWAATFGGHESVKLLCGKL